MSKHMYAFPQSQENDGMHEDYNGMLLRDYFAAKAMQTLCGSQMSDKDIAVNAYLMADEMLKVREGN